MSNAFELLQQFNNLSVDDLVKAARDVKDDSQGLYNSLFEQLDIANRKGKKVKEEIQKCLDQEQKDLIENLQCCVCQDQKKTILLLPCRHLCICQTCSDATGTSKLSKCPVCRSTIVEKLKVYS